MNHFDFAVPGGAWMAALFAVAFAIVSVREWIRVRDMSPGRRRALVFLRVVTALVAFGVAVQPVYSAPDVDETEGRIVVLLDGSRSMSIEHAGHVRSEVVEGVRQQWAGAENVDFRAFSATVRPVGTDELTFEGGDSWIGAAIDSVRNEDDVGAVVLVTDGAETGTAATAREGGVRVFAVPAGSDDLRDDAIVRMDADPVAFLRRPAQVRVAVRRSLERGAVPVRLTMDGNVIQERLVELAPDGTGEVLLNFTPRQLGRSVYRVSIPTERGDEVTENNSRQFMVRVIRDRLRVLLVAGRPTWDVRFLRAFLERDASIDLISFFILRSNADIPGADQGELALIPFPTDELFREHLGSFDVIFFQDFDFEPYDMSGYLPGIARYVERGGSFAMIGGQGSFGAGGYSGTPIGDVLPVRFENVGRPERGVEQGEFQPRLQEAFTRHPIVRLTEDSTANAQTWAGLAPLIGANRLRDAKPEAHVLLVHPRNNMPVLVTGTAGEGRVLALAADTSWRWGMTSAGESGDASVHGRFWDRALRWLARDPALEPARINTDQERYASGAQVGVTGVVRDPRYAAFPGEQPVELRLVDEHDALLQRQPLTLDSDDGFEAQLEAPDEAGVFRLAVYVGDELVAEEPFVVEGGGAELADVRVRRDELERLAVSSGGRLMEIEDLVSPDELDTSRRFVRGVARVAPFATVWAALLLVVLLGVSWWFRRRWGEF